MKCLARFEEIVNFSQKIEKHENVLKNLRKLKTLGVNPELFRPKISRADFKNEKKVNLRAKKSIRSRLFKTFYTVARNGDAAQATTRTRIQLLGSSSTVVINVG